MVVTSTTNLLHLVLYIMTRTLFLHLLYPIIHVVPSQASKICLDRENLTFTFPCGFDICTIPGQYCDQSDSDYHRCGKCDIDICNEGLDSHPECKLQCLDMKKDKVLQPNKTFWNEERCWIFLSVMIVSIVINGTQLVFGIVCRVRLKKAKEIQHLTTDKGNVINPSSDSTEMKILALSSSSNNTHVVGHNPSSDSTETKTMAITNSSNNTDVV